MAPSQHTSVARSQSGVEVAQVIFPGVQVADPAGGLHAVPMSPAAGPVDDPTKEDAPPELELPLVVDTLPEVDEPEPDVDAVAEDMLPPVPVVEPLVVVEPFVAALVDADVCAPESGWAAGPVVLLLEQSTNDIMPTPASRAATGETQRIQVRFIEEASRACMLFVLAAM